MNDTLRWAHLEFVEVLAAESHCGSSLGIDIADYHVYRTDNGYHIQANRPHPFCRVSYRFLLSRGG